MDNLPETYDFWNKYRENYNAYDKVILVKYGRRSLYLDDSTEPSESYDHFKELFNSFLEGSAYEYQRKWDALKAEYSPIENYDRTESTTTTTDAKTDTITKDAKTDTTHNPQVTVTASGGTVVETDQNSPFDAGFSDVAKATTVQPQTTTTQSANDVSIDYAQDKTTNNYGQDKTTVSSHVHGNVGVTTNQQMISAELELRANVFIYDVIHDIINNIAYY